MVRKKNLMIVFGTRPEAIKLWPIIKRLEHHERFSLVVVNTAQHQELLDETMHDLEIQPDIVFAQQLGGRSLSKLSSELMHNFDKVIEQNQPDLLILQGDTSSAFHAALAAFHAKIPIAHVEAGLRSGNLNHPYPEEFYRISISKIASLHFAPTESASINLKQEGIPDDSIFVTGNTGIDALKMAMKRTSIDSNNGRKDGYILITCHRRESSGERLQVLLEGIKEFASKFPEEEIRFVLHLNPNFYSKIKKSLMKINNIKLLEPTSYFNFVALIAGAKFIVTDSGGIQEEAPYLGKLTLVYREITERNESVDLGYSRYLPSNKDAIVNELTMEARENSRYFTNTKPYGDGNATDTIVKKIDEYFKKGKS